MRTRVNSTSTGTHFVGLPVDLVCTTLPALAALAQYAP